MLILRKGALAHDVLDIENSVACVLVESLPDIPIVLVSLDFEL